MKRLSIVLFFALLGFGAWGWFRLNQPEPPMALTEPLRIDQGEIQGGVDPDNPLGVGALTFLFVVLCLPLTEQKTQKNT